MADATPTLSVVVNVLPFWGLTPQMEIVG